MRTVAIFLPFTLLLGCEAEVEHIHDRVACGASTGAGESSGGESSTAAEGGSSGGSSTGSEASSGGEEGSSGESSTGEPGDGDDIPEPTAPCPTIHDGVVQFCPAGLGGACRNALVYNATGADGTGPLSLHWHGTFESPDGIMSWDTAAQQIQEMVVREHGLMVLPYADPAAPARTNTPFPWWVVCGSSGTQCNRLDDFILADEIVACTVDQGLVDPNRLTTSGMSAGGTMTSHLVDRMPYFAGAVSWSGGVPPAYQPATPENETALLVLHGGATDAYCGPGALGGTGCYYFRPPSESLAAAAAAAGNFTFLCDHQAGHTTAMALQGAYFLAWSHRENGHVWEGYPFGTGGNPGTGSSWMLNHYCYLPGEPSPWDPHP